MPSKNYTGADTRAAAALSKFVPNTTPEPQQQTEAPDELTEKKGCMYVAAPDPFTEKRDRRVQLVLRPSLVSGLKYVAKSKKQSMNNLIEEILTEYINRAKEEYQKGKG